jgi:hypothetical protein
MIIIINEWSIVPSVNRSGKLKAGNIKLETRGNWKKRDKGENSFRKL